VAVPEHAVILSVILSVPGCNYPAWRHGQCGPQDALTLMCCIKYPSTFTDRALPTLEQQSAALCWPARREPASVQVACCTNQLWPTLSCALQALLVAGGPLDTLRQEEQMWWHTCVHLGMRALGRRAE